MPRSLVQPQDLKTLQNLQFDLMLRGTGETLKGMLKTQVQLAEVQRKSVAFMNKNTNETEAEI